MKKFKQYLKEDIEVYDSPSNLKPAKYEVIKIFKDGWQKIELPKPIPEESEIDKLIAICHGATEKDREEYKKCDCLLYTSPSPRDGLLSRMPSSA